MRSTLGGVEVTGSGVRTAAVGLAINGRSLALGTFRHETFLPPPCSATPLLPAPPGSQREIVSLGSFPGQGHALLVSAAHGAPVVWLVSSTQASSDSHRLSWPQQPEVRRSPF
eukprot:scaffold12640_cov106-Isochrysis_galbana.AAC.4